MKIRFSPVSNSSSSSFILMGYKIDDTLSYKELVETFIPFNEVEKNLHEDDDISTFTEDEWCDMWYEVSECCKYRLIDRGDESYFGVVV